MGLSLRFVCFLMVLAGSNMAGWWWFSPNSVPADVLQVSFEEGDLAQVSSEQALHFAFSVPMITTEEGLTDPVLDPPWPATWTWETSRRLRFTPLAPLPKATNFHVTFPKERLLTRDGFWTESSPKFSFQTEALRFVNAWQVNREPSGEVVVALDFNQNVSGKQLLKHLELQLAGFPIEAELHGEAGDKRVLVRTSGIAGRNPNHQRLRIALSPGLRGDEGPLAITEAVERTVTLSKRTILSGIECYPGSTGPITVRCRFSGKVSAEAVERMLSIDPPVAVDVQQGYSSVRLVGLFKPRQTYRITLRHDEKASKADESGLLWPAAGSLDIRIPDRRGEVNFPHGSGYLGTQRHRHIDLNVVNIDDLQVTAHRLEGRNIPVWRGVLNGELYSSAVHLARQTGELAIRPGGTPDQTTSIPINLDSLLGSASTTHGCFLITARGTQRTGRRYPRTHVDRIMVTLADIGLMTRFSQESLHVWAHDLSTTRASEGTQITVWNQRNEAMVSAVCDAMGHAILDLPQQPEDGTPTLITAQSVDGQTTWVDLTRGVLDSAGCDISGRRPTPPDHGEALLWAERTIFRPGDTLRIRGLVQHQGASVAFPAQWLLYRPDGRLWRGLETTVPAHGGAALDVPLPQALPRGRWEARLALPGEDAPSLGQVAFRVEDVVPDRLKLLVHQPKNTTSTSLRFGIEGHWLFGQPATGLTFSGYLKGMAQVPSFPGWEAYSFTDDPGRQTDHEHPLKRTHSRQMDPLTISSTGSALAVFAENDLPRARDWPGSWSMGLAASLHEPGGRTVSGSSMTIWHPHSSYPAIWAEERVEDEGYRLSINVATITPAATFAHDEIRGSLSCERISWSRRMEKRGGYWRQQTTRRLSPIHENIPIAGHRGQAQTELEVYRPGRYLLRFRLDDGRHVAQTVTIGSDRHHLADNPEHPGRLHMMVTPSTTSGLLKPGDTAQISIQSPFPGRLLLTVERDRILHSVSRTLSSTASVISIPVSKEWGSGAYIHASIIRGIEDSLQEWRLHRARGMTYAAIDMTQQRLHTALDGPSSFAPNQELLTRATITDHLGKPAAGAWVSASVVDQGLLAAASHQLPHPADYFYAKIRSQFKGTDIYHALLPDLLRPMADAIIGGDAMPDRLDPSRYASPVDRRPDASPRWTSQWMQADEAGHVNIRVPIGAYVGAVRIGIIAKDQKRYGQSTHELPVTQALRVLTTTPRFVAPGDHFTVSLQIQHDDPSAEVTWAATGPDFALNSGQVDSGHVSSGHVGPSTGNQVARLVLRAPQETGLHTLTVSARSGSQTWQEQLVIPVRAPYPRLDTVDFHRVHPGNPWRPPNESNAIQGTQRFTLNAGPMPDFGITAATERLRRYPHGCAEQRLSGVFPLLSLMSGATDPLERQTMQRWVEETLGHLALMQTHDGGLAMWPGYRRAWPWASAYAAHFVAEAEAFGVKVDPYFKDNLMRYCRDLAGTGKESTTDIDAAYACLALELNGENTDASRRQLRERAEGLSGKARAYLALADVAAGAIEQISGFTSSTKTAIPPIDHEMAALELSALLKISPNREDIPERVRALAKAGRNGWWGSTRSTALVVTALGRWRLQQPPTTAYKDLQLVSGSTVLASTAGNRELIWRHEGALPSDLSLIVSGPTTASAHVSWQSSGIPKNAPAPHEKGLTVQRRFSPAPPWHKGQLIEVNLEVETLRPTSHIVVEDLLPAGLEAENPKLATNLPAWAQDRPAGRLDITDDRVVWMVHHLKHRQQATYLARAVTPGSFTLPPVRAEDMYDAETSALGATSLVEIRP